MSLFRGCLSASISAVLLSALATAAPAEASKTIEDFVEEIDIVRVSPNLTALCGIRVTVHSVGKRHWRIYEEPLNGEPGLMEHVNNNITTVAWTEHGEVSFKHTGNWRFFIDQNGITYFVSSGQAALGSKGHEVINETEQVVEHEFSTTVEEALAEFCPILNPDF